MPRVARFKTFAQKLDEARIALNEASASAMLNPDRVTRDQEIAETVSAWLNLADSQLREATPNTDPGFGAGLYSPRGLGGDLEFEGPKPLPETSTRDQMAWLRQAEASWERAAQIAVRIENATEQSEILYRVAEDEANGGVTLLSYARNQRQGDYSSEGGTRRNRDIEQIAGRLLALCRRPRGGHPPAGLARQGPGCRLRQRLLGGPLRPRLHPGPVDPRPRSPRRHVDPPGGVRMPPPAQ